MRPIPKIVLIATLALGASFSIAGLKSVGADAQGVAGGSRDSISRAGSLISRSSGSSTNPAQATFEPEPNDPPVRTGGAGSR